MTAIQWKVDQDPGGTDLDFTLVESRAQIIPKASVPVGPCRQVRSEHLDIVQVQAKKQTNIEIAGE
jgi:hypothetical protein